MNVNDTIHPCLSFCSALKNIFTTYKQAVAIFRNVTLTSLSESNDSFHTFDPHARDSDDMPNSQQLYQNLGDLGEPGTFFSSLANELTCECFEIIPLTPAPTFTLKLLVNN